MLFLLDIDSTPITLDEDYNTEYLAKKRKS
jgi:hypothetical protein